MHYIKIVDYLQVYVDNHKSCHSNKFEYQHSVPNFGYFEFLLALMVG